MAKVQLKSDNINPFGGIYPVFGDNDDSRIVNANIHLFTEPKNHMNVM